MCIEYKLQKLNELGAGEIEHINGSLIDHLKGTKKLLESWSASRVLQDAGLYHAAYGTDGFNQSLLSPEERVKIAEIIGAEAEEIVYLYCACERESFWPQVGREPNPEFKNRFTGELSRLNEDQIRNFCELTVANELEIARDNPSFLKEHGPALSYIFSNMRPYLTEQAYSMVEAVLGRNTPLAVEL